MFGYSEWAATGGVWAGMVLRPSESPADAGQACLKISSCGEGSKSSLLLCDCPSNGVPTCIALALFPTLPLRAQSEADLDWQDWLAGQCHIQYCFGEAGTIARARLYPYHWGGAPAASMHSSDLSLLNSKRRSKDTARPESGPCGCPDRLRIQPYGLRIWPYGLPDRPRIRPFLFLF